MDMDGCMYICTLCLFKYDVWNIMLLAGTFLNCLSEETLTKEKRNIKNQIFFHHTDKKDFKTSPAADNFFI